MRILVLSFYYRPDLSAGSFRATSLVESLRLLAPDLEIDVVTTLPNRYHSFSVEAPEEEQDGPVRVRRIALPPHKSGMADQARAFTEVRIGAMRAVAGRSYDIVFGTSSRLMTATLAARIARQKRAALYLDIRDIFADTMKDVLRGPQAAVARIVFGWFERWTIGRADKVNLVSGGFLPYFRSRYPSQRFSCITNGIDDEFVAAAPAVAVPGPGRLPRTIVYAGNLGEGQGLHRIIPGLARALADRARFVIVGDGGRRQALVDALREAGVTNVELLAPVPRAELLRLYQAADVLFLHLNDYEAFHKVLPSKLFEYGATGKPVWAGIGGYAAEFTRREIANSAVFAPCDVASGLKAFASLEQGITPRPEFVRRFRREAVSLELARDILSLVRT